ncbi:hypothetical protein T484DRAFT_1755097 [Baffinella frigidus]|nr:hypothetical protein T484DRAFT_1755097 [Cryptophyta sp. CCMP2293]
MASFAAIDYSTYNTCKESCKCQKRYMCMSGYTQVTYTELEKQVVTDIQDCIQQLVSERYIGKAQDMLDYFNASKRMVPFMHRFNLAEGTAGCPCDKRHLGGDLMCMHPGAFDVYRLYEFSTDFFCLICGNSGYQDTGCVHQVLLDDCKKLTKDMSQFPRGGTYGNEDHMASCLDHKRQLAAFLKNDKAMALSESGRVFIPEYQVLEREWRASMVKAQVALDLTEQNRVQTAWMALACE